MLKKQSEKSFPKFLVTRIGLPLVLLFGAVFFVYYFSFEKQSQEKVENASSIQDFYAPSYGQEKNSLEASQEPELLPEKDVPEEKMEPAEVEEEMPLSVQSQNLESPSVVESVSPPLALNIPVKSGVGNAGNYKGDLGTYILFSDFIVRARTGLPFEGALLQLDQTLKDPMLKKKLLHLLPYSLEGLGSWPVLMNDLNRVLERGVHTKGKSSDPWLVRFVKSFLHVRKKSRHGTLLQEALEARDWPEVYKLTDLLIQEGFPLKKWRLRLKRYVQGHVLLNSFFIAHQTSSTSMEKDS